MTGSSWIPAVLLAATFVALAVSGVEPRFRISYDCDPDSDAVGPASLIMCVERPTPNKLCVDYSLRAYVN